MYVHGLYLFRLILLVLRQLNLVLHFLMQRLDDQIVVFFILGPQLLGVLFTHVNVYGLLLFVVNYDSIDVSHCYLLQKFFGILYE
jgi:hypothetical protein